MTAGPAPDEGPQELLETIDEAGCRRLLAALDVGRLAIVDEGRPRIIVLNYVTDGPHVLFRTREDALLARLTEGGATVHAEFEVDSAFTAARTGWSVIATGTLTREQVPARQAAARDRIQAWAQGERDTVLRLDVTELSGRQVGAL
jgi:nitroimidazol reductase NimA-like FMN-containing flavoprotein (pyridoxamine 5'-phosphate oxidase superfamily)